MKTTLFAKIMVPTILFAIGAATANAQFSISNINPGQVETQIRKDTTISEVSGINNPYFSQGRFMAEKRQLRKERNTINLATGVTITQTGFSNWNKGGDNTFAGRATLDFKHAYKRDKYNADYSVTARYGIVAIDTASFKNEDMFFIHGGVNWDINKNWAYGASVDFKSQFTKGRKSMSDTTLVSSFMAPGTLDIGGGFTYKHSKEKLEINISPIAGRMLFVLNEYLSSKGVSGIKPGDKFHSTLGSSLRVNYEKGFLEDKLFYKAFLYAFTNYQSSKPKKEGEAGKNRSTVHFDNTLSYKLGKLFTISAFLSTFYEDYSQLPADIEADRKRDFDRSKLQFNYVLGFGLTYTLSNK